MPEVVVVAVVPLILLVIMTLLRLVKITTIENVMMAITIVIIILDHPIQMMMTKRNCEHLQQWTRIRFVGYVKNDVNQRGVILRVIVLVAGHRPFDIEVINNNNNSSSSGLILGGFIHVIGGWDIVVVVVLGMAEIHLMTTIIPMEEDRIMIPEV